MKSVRTLALLMAATFINAPAFAGGIKNEQHILGGMLTRAGVRDLDQLSDSQLKDLCEEGYSKAYFLYNKATPRTIKCSKGSISYKYVSWKNSGDIMESVSKALEGGGKVFVHCHNGAHASGAVAATALRQFCGYSYSDAMSYFDRTNDYGTPPGYGSIKKFLKGYDPVSGLSGRCP